MSKKRSPYPPEFRQQIVDLARAGRNPEELAREFGPSGQAI
ncbi:MAG: transposase, partial [Reyranellaceae bacterium]